MADTFRPRIIEDQPCKRGCVNRAPGCAITCPEWAKYLEKRNKHYKETEIQAERYCRTYSSIKRTDKFKKRKT